MTDQTSTDGACLVLRSSERLVRIGLVLSTATVAAGLAPFVLQGLPVAQVVAPVLVTVLAAVTAWRLARTGTTVDAAGIHERRVWTLVTYPWPAVAAFSIGRRAGQWGGLCVRVHHRRGPVRDLAGTAMHATVPSPDAVAELEGVLAVLETHVLDGHTTGRIDAVSPRFS